MNEVKFYVIYRNIRNFATAVTAKSFRNSIKQVPGLQPL